MKITSSFGGNNDNNDANDELAALSLSALHVEPHVGAGFCVTRMKEWVQVQEAALTSGQPTSEKLWLLTEATQLCLHHTGN